MVPPNSIFPFLYPCRENSQMLEWTSISCPYCGENFETSLDLSGGSQSYIEDCQVCCRPMGIRLTVYDPDTSEFGVGVERSGE